MQTRKKLYLLLLELTVVVPSVLSRLWALFRHVSFLSATQTKTFSDAIFTFFLCQFL